MSDPFDDWIDANIGNLKRSGWFQNMVTDKLARELGRFPPPGAHGAAFPVHVPSYRQLAKVAKTSSPSVSFDTITETSVTVEVLRQGGMRVDGHAIDDLTDKTARKLVGMFERDIEAMIASGYDPAGTVTVHASTTVPDPAHAPLRWYSGGGTIDLWSVPAGATLTVDDLVRAKRTLEAIGFDAYLDAPQIDPFGHLFNALSQECDRRGDCKLATITNTVMMGDREIVHGSLWKGGQVDRFTIDRMMLVNADRHADLIAEKLMGWLRELHQSRPTLCKLCGQPPDPEAEPTEVMVPDIPDLWHVLREPGQRYLPGTWDALVERWGTTPLHACSPHCATAALMALDLAMVHNLPPAKDRPDLRQEQEQIEHRQYQHARIKHVIEGSTEAEFRYDVWGTGAPLPPKPPPPLPEPNPIAPDADFLIGGLPYGTVPYTFIGGCVDPTCIAYGQNVTPLHVHEARRA